MTKRNRLCNRLLSLALCALLLLGLTQGLPLEADAAVVTYETVCMINDFSSTSGVGVTRSATNTERFRSGPSSLKMQALEGEKTAFWKTTMNPKPDLTAGGKYTKDDLALAFWLYVEEACSVSHLVQICSSDGWQNSLYWNVWTSQLTTKVGEWVFVTLPFSTANVSGSFDLSAMLAYRFDQGSNTGKHTYYIDDLQVVDLNQPSYSWSEVDLNLTTTLSKESPELDENFTLTCDLENTDKNQDMSNWTLSAQVNNLLIDLDSAEATKTFSVAKGGTTQLVLPMKAVEGGAGTIDLTVKDNQGSVILTRQVPITIRGKKQWYEADVQVDMAWANDAPKAGEIATLNYTLTNLNVAADIVDWTVDCSFSPLWASSTATSHTLSVEADQSQSGSFDIRFSEGGSGLIQVTFTDNQDRVVVTKQVPITVDGTGYYKGDSHTHTTASDGVDTFLANFQVARSRGHAWIYATDHNAAMSQSYDRYQFDLAKDTMLAERFLALYGSEVTTKHGHMVATDISKHYIPDSTDATYVDIPEGVSVETWREVLAEIEADGGISYLAHPFATGPYPGLEMDPTRTDVYSQFVGVEIINMGESTSRYDNNTATSTLKTYASEYWDRMNLLGNRKYFAWASTDAHKKEDVALFYNGLLLDELTEEAVNNALRTGKFYGSAGPEIRFSLGGKELGETAYATPGAQLPVSVKAYSDVGAITKVVLYGFDINDANGYQNGRNNAIVLFEDADGSENKTFFEYTGTVNALANGFYRMEVYTTDLLYGYAFSNPIWTAEGQEPGAQEITPKADTVLKQGDTLVVSNPAEDMTVGDLLDCLTPSIGVQVVGATADALLTDGMTVRLVAGSDVLETLTVELRHGAVSAEGVSGGIIQSGSSKTAYEVIYTIDDYSKYAGVGRTNATYEPKVGHNRNGSVCMVPSSSTWKTGYAVDLNYYTGGNNEDMALSFWVKTDNLNAGALYTVQITSTATWGAPHIVFYSVNPLAGVTKTDEWTRVILPFSSGSNDSFSFSNYSYFRMFQSNTTTEDFKIYLDEVQIVRMVEEPVYVDGVSGNRFALTDGEVSVAVGEQPARLSLRKASVSGSRTAALVADLWVEDAAALGELTLTASYGGDAQNGVTWTVTGLTNGQNHLVLPISQEAVTSKGIATQWVGNGPSYFFEQNRVYALDTLTLTGGAETVVFQDLALYTTQGETSVLAVEKVEALIEALPEEPALSDEEAVVAARAALDALAADHQALVSADLLVKLTAAEEEIAELKAAADQAAADKAAADGVVAMIQALQVEDLSDKTAVVAARAAYNALTEVQKTLVTNLDALTAAEEAIATLEAEADQAEVDQAAADAVIALIDALAVTTLEDKADVEAARAAYDALTEAQKALVTNLETLTAAEAVIAELQAADQAAADKAAADDVMAKIEALAVTTLEDKADVEAARAAYDALTETQKALVENVEKLTAAEAVIAELQAAADQAAADKAAADDVMAKIEALAVTTLEDKADVEAARAAYDALTETQKALVENVEKLTAAEAVIADLQAAADQAEADKAAAQAVTDAINALTEESTEEEVAAVRAAYEALTEAQKALVSSESLEKLAALEEKFQPVAITYGDADGNGTVDAADALKALQHAVKLTTLEGDLYTAANVNGDDKVDAADALLMLQYAVKLIDKFPVESK